MQGVDRSTGPGPGLHGSSFLPLKGYVTLGLLLPLCEVTVVCLAEREVRISEGPFHTTAS